MSEQQPGNLKSFTVSIQLYDEKLMQMVRENKIVALRDEDGEIVGAMVSQPAPLFRLEFSP